MDWQAFSSQLVAMLLPHKTWPPGTFENADRAALLAECRAAAKTDARLELASQEVAAKVQRREAALSRLTADERRELGIGI